MCAGDDRSCPEYESHRLRESLSLDRERRSFVKSAFAAAGGVAALGAGGISLVTPEMARAAAANQPAKRAYHHLPATSETVHWGYFSKKLKPQVEIDPGDFVTIEALTHHAGELCYRLCGGYHHHHLVCTGCHRVVELRDCDLDPWVTRSARKHGFTATGHQVEIVGLCASCRG